MDLKRLRYFVCVSELGSFTLAARNLGVAQPALSRHIRQLEADCGSALLRRNGRGAEPTEVGRTVLEHGRSLLAQVDRLEAGLKAAKGAPVGAINLGLPPSVCMILVEPLFHRVRDEFPGIRLHISEAFSGDVREASSFYRQVFDRQMAANNFAAAAETANALGRVYLETGDLDNATKWYQTGYETTRRQKDMSGGQIDLADLRWAHAQARIAARRGSAATARAQVAEVTRLLGKGANYNGKVEFSDADTRAK